MQEAKVLEAYIAVGLRDGAKLEQYLTEGHALSVKFAQASFLDRIRLLFAGMPSMPLSSWHDFQQSPMTFKRLLFESWVASDIIKSRSIAMIYFGMIECTSSIRYGAHTTKKVVSSLLTNDTIGVRDIFPPLYFGPYPPLWIDTFNSRG